jgi:alpha-L-fucosidase 2
MLVQSHAGEIALLPALPRAWPTGRVTGLRVRGALEIDIAWRDARATEVRLRPLVSGSHLLRPPRGQTIATISPDGKPISITADRDGIVRVSLVADRRYVLTFNQP